MYLCSEKHEEICHEGNRCPVCDAIEELENEISDLNSEISNLERKLEDVESQE